MCQGHDVAVYKFSCIYIKYLRHPTALHKPGDLVTTFRVVLYKLNKTQNAVTAATMTNGCKITNYTGLAAWDAVWPGTWSRIFRTVLFKEGSAKRWHKNGHFTQVVVLIFIHFYNNIKEWYTLLTVHLEVIPDNNQLITLFLNVFISCLYMLRARSAHHQEDQIVLTHHLV